MPLLLTSGPAIEPVTLAEAKAHLRVDASDEDTLIASLITSARIHIEAVLGRALITQSWSLFLDAWPPERMVELARVPVQSVDEVRVYDGDGAAVILDATSYVVDTVSEPARLVARAAAAWPQPGQAANGIEIRFTAGYGAAASDVPQPLRQAILLLVAHWFETREPVAMGARAMEVPATIIGLLAPYRRNML